MLKHDTNFKLSIRNAGSTAKNVHTNIVQIV